MLYSISMFKPRHSPSPPMGASRSHSVHSDASGTRRFSGSIPIVRGRPPPRRSAYISMCSARPSRSGPSEKDSPSSDLPSCAPPPPTCSSKLASNWRIVAAGAPPPPRPRCPRLRISDPTGWRRGHCPFLPYALRGVKVARLTPSVSRSAPRSSRAVPRSSSPSNAKAPSSSKSRRITPLAPARCADGAVHAWTCVAPAALALAPTPIRRAPSTSDRSSGTRRPSEAWAPKRQRTPVPLRSPEPSTRTSAPPTTGPASGKWCDATSGATYSNSNAFPPSKSWPFKATETEDDEPKVARGGEVHAMAVALRKVAGVVEASGGCGVAPARSKPQRRGEAATSWWKWAPRTTRATPPRWSPRAGKTEETTGGRYSVNVSGGAASRGSATGGGEAGRCPSLTFRLYGGVSAPLAGGRKEPRKARPVGKRAAEHSSAHHVRPQPYVA